MKLNIFYIIALPIFLISCNGQNPKAVHLIDVKTYAEKLNSTDNPQIIDVRTPEEFEPSHINGAVNINWFDGDFASKVTSFDKTKPVFVYCKVGGRSIKAANKLAKLGFTTVYDMEGGYIKWEAAAPAQNDTKTAGISKADYDKLLTSKNKVLINFYAPWCAPCKKMESYILKMQKEKAAEVLIVRLNADENKTMVRNLNIEELPGLFLYENGKLKWSSYGFVSEEDLRKQLL